MYTKMEQILPTKNNKTTTIKIKKETKQRLDNLKEYKRETYEDIMEKMIDIVNLCKFNPAKARAKLIGIERQRRKSNI